MHKIDGTEAAEAVAAFVGSWRFVIWQNVAVLAWALLNIVAIFGLRWDPAPFILLNLIFSWQASNTGPILQMTGNAGAKRDRAQATRIESLERILDEHVNTTAREHTAELRANTILTEEIHRMLTERRESVDAKPAHAVRDASGRFTKAGA